MPQNDSFKSFSTVGGGDCAFHAIFGEYDPDTKQFVCKNVEAKRREIADLIKRKYLAGEPELVRIIDTGVFEAGDATLVDATQFPYITDLLNYIRENQYEEGIKVRNVFSDMLVNSEVFKKKIDDFIRIEKPTYIDNGYFTKFSAFFNDKSIVEVRDLMRECDNTGALLEAFNEYYNITEKLKANSTNISEQIARYFASNPNKKELVLDELVNNIISTPREWIPQHFIPAIALAAEQKIVFHINSPETGTLNKGVVYGKKTEQNKELVDEVEDVRIYFNGFNHYERVVDIKWDPLTQLTKLPEAIDENQPTLIIKTKKTQSQTQMQTLPLSHPEQPVDTVPDKPITFSKESSKASTSTIQLKEVAEQYYDTLIDNIIKSFNNIAHATGANRVEINYTKINPTEDNNHTIAEIKQAEDQQLLAVVRPDTIECPLVQ